MNPFKSDVSIQQDEVLGKAELIDPKNIDVILSSDSLFENQQSTRRIQLDKCSQKGDNSQTDNLRNSQKDECTNVSNVPDHLSDLYCRAIVDKNPDEEKEISIILHKYQDTFSKTDTDLGITNLVYHEIDTGDSRPIKKPTRRVPYTLAAII